jgi:hypothetical protein
VKQNDNVSHFSLKDRALDTGEITHRERQHRRLEYWDRVRQYIDSRTFTGRTVISSVTMGVKIVKTINDRDRKRRVEIYKRSDGSFGFAEWQFGTEEQSWYPVGRYSHAIIDTLENAEKEARSRVRWLADEAEER